VPEASRSAVASDENTSPDVGVPTSTRRSIVTARKPLFCLTAGDLMSRDLIVLHRDAPLRDAAQRLLNAQVHGAPVVDHEGRCVGVLSVTDFLRHKQHTPRAAEPLPRSCSYQQKVRAAGGRELTVCTLPLGVCPFQCVHREPDGRQLTVCVQPHCVCTDWQVVEADALPEERVSHFMTADPVLVTGDRTIHELARMMIDAHIHRVIVTDGQSRPIGVVSSTDLLAAVAYAVPGTAAGNHGRG
jgi:CBS domain-containing protein